MEIWLLCFIKDILLIEMPVDQVVTNANIDTAKTLTGDTICNVSKLYYSFLKKMICFLYELFQRKVNDCTAGPHCHKKKDKKRNGKKGKQLSTVRRAEDTL